MAEHWHALSIIAQWLVLACALWLIRRCSHKTDALAQDKRRKDDFAVDQEKFATQRGITYALLLLFASVVAEVLWRNIETERSTMLQTVINLVMLAVGYWLRASKQGTDQAQAMSKIAESAPAAAKEAKEDAKEAADKAVNLALVATPGTKAADIATPAPTPTPDPAAIAAGEVKVTGENVVVQETPKDKT